MIWGYIAIFCGLGFMFFTCILWRKKILPIEMFVFFLIGEIILISLSPVIVNFFALGNPVLEGSLKSGELYYLVAQAKNTRNSFLLLVPVEKPHNEPFFVKTASVIEDGYARVLAIKNNEGKISLLPYGAPR